MGLINLKRSNPLGANFGALEALARQNISLQQFSANYRKSLSSDRLVFSILITAILAILAEIGLLLISWSKLPPLVPLFYSRTWGADYLVNKIMIIILPSLNIVFVAINYAILVFIVMPNAFLGRVLAIFGLVVTLGLLYDLIKIISLLT